MAQTSPAPLHSTSLHHSHRQPARSRPSAFSSCPIPQCVGPLSRLAESRSQRLRHCLSPFSHTFNAKDVCHPRTWPQHASARASALGRAPAPEVFVPSSTAQALLSPQSLAQAEPTPSPPTAGPEELPPASVETYETYDPYTEEEPPSLFQSGASLLLTGALTVLLFRAFRRRLAKSKEERLRSGVVERLSPKSEVEKAKADLAATSAAGPAAPAPTALSALGGAVVAALFSYVAYQFTTGVDDIFARQPVSNAYTVRQITITVRTIISGMGWLATGVFGANALGLTLLAFQIALGLDPGSEGKDKDKAGAKEEPGAQPSEEETKQ